MTRDTTLRAINCTSCGAGLDVHGGGRVLSHVCSYCGAELDATENYRVLAKFENLQRPESPLKIGMRGTIDGLEFTVIGTLGMTERWAGRVWTWVEHQVFSPTHGYIWLTWEEGHLVWTRKYRGEVTPRWISSATVEAAESRPSAVCAGERFTYFETTTAETTFAEGEFNWRPHIGDKTVTVSCLSDGAMLDFVDDGAEREVEITRYLPQAETLAAFGAEVPGKPPFVHPVQKPWRMRDDKFLFGVGAMLAMACFIVAILFGADRGREVLAEQRMATSALPVEVSFELTDTEKLALIQLYADVSNAWAWLEVSLTGPDDLPVFEAGREVGYYRGRDADGSWTEGSQRATLRFHPPEPGRYTLEIDVPESGTWQRSGAALSNVGISVYEGAKSGFWLFLASLGVMVPGLAAYGGYLLSRRRRWKGSDWTDED